MPKAAVKSKAEPKVKKGRGKKGKQRMDPWRVLTRLDLAWAVS